MMDQGAEPISLGNKVFDERPFEPQLENTATSCSSDKLRALTLGRMTMDLNFSILVHAARAGLKRNNIVPGMHIISESRNTVGSSNQHSQTQLPLPTAGNTHQSILVNPYRTPAFISGLPKIIRLDMVLKDYFKITATLVESTDESISQQSIDDTLRNFPPSFSTLIHIWWTAKMGIA
ncbi:hypothetical protein BGZ60DRAFT_515245 [Tricladium varicosporioides]|nr:hypothetical protein BGZ60DRAFT_515245 [Hymenoscyphus varicosporioides]